MSPRPVTITSYNMHKGMSALNRKVQVNRMADALGALGSDVLFLQEVQGQHLNRSRRTDFPDAPTDMANPDGTTKRMAAKRGKMAGRTFCSKKCR